MASKDNLLAELQDYADTSGDDSVKASLGTPGDYVEIDNVARPTGAAYATPGVIDGLLTAIGAVIDGLISGGGAGTVKITISDATSGYLASKLVAGNGIILTVHTGVDSDQTLEVAADFGTGAGDVCEGNDVRLSDARTPLAHHDSHVNGTDTVPTATESAPGLCPILDGEATHYLDGTGNWTTPAGGEQFPGFGTTEGTCAEGNDSRLSDDRTASGLRTASTVVAISSAVAPSAAQLLAASSSTAGAWRYLWVVADPPPASPNARDDEFDGASAVVWSWIRAGQPTSTSGIYTEADGTTNGKRWAKVLNDAAGNYHSVAHQLTQSSPTGDFTAFVKLTAEPQINYAGFGIIIDDGSDNNLTSWYLGTSTAGWSVAALWRSGGGAYSYNQCAHTYHGSTVYLKVAYSESGHTFTFSYSPDNVLWLTGGQQTGLGWEPSRMGMSWYADNSTAGEYGASFEFFRVIE